MKYLVALIAVLTFGLVAQAQPRPGFPQPVARPVVNNYYFQPNYNYLPYRPVYNPYLNTPFYPNPFYRPYPTYGFNYGFQYQFQYRFGYGYGW
jgi:hypothetical protein